MNLKNLSDGVLLANTKNLVTQERVLVTDLLHHLREVDRRRLYSKLQYRSLFHYAVAHLGYPEDQAYRRISAMKMLSEIPEIEEKMNSGKLSLSNVTLAQKFFRQEKQTSAKVFSIQEKMEVLQSLENKSTREAEKVVMSLSATPAQVFRTSSKVPTFRG